MSESSNTLAPTPTFSACTAFGFIGATVTGTGCEFVLHLGEESGSHFGGTTDLSCESGKKIIIATAPCKAQVSPKAGKERNTKMKAAPARSSSRPRSPGWKTSSRNPASGALSVFQVAGGIPAEIVPTKSDLVKKAGSPAACPGIVFLSGNYVVSLPTQMFVTFK
jgi:hypothetical protein